MEIFYKTNFTGLQLVHCTLTNMEIFYKTNFTGLQLVHC